MARAQLLDALVEQRHEQHLLGRRLAPVLLRARRVQHLLDGVVEAIDVALHAAEERAALLGIGVVAAERVEVEPQRRERRAHLVRDRVEERALALVQAHLAHEPRRERDEPREHEHEEERAEDQHQPVARRETLR